MGSHPSLHFIKSTTSRPPECLLPCAVSRTGPVEHRSLSTL